jgi:3-hydroxyisobutyrate dehydrogenase-like beta-hydroxyacid dehydrogenase
MAATSARVGFVGLGHMGGNMASRLLAAGHPVYGEARSREHAKTLIEEGLRWCDTPRVGDAQSHSTRRLGHVPDQFPRLGRP